jgi:hypothetical protein
VFERKVAAHPDCIPPGRSPVPGRRRDITTVIRGFGERAYFGAYGKLHIPDGNAFPAQPPAPPPDPRVARAEKIANDTRVESELNRFIASKQDALFNNPDAFYRTQGEDAIHAAPVARKNLEQLRDDLLAGLANDYQRQRLAPRSTRRCSSPASRWRAMWPSRAWRGNAVSRRTASRS